MVDPVGSGLALVTLVGMAAVAGVTVYRVSRRAALKIRPIWWQIPLLAGGGVLLSAYLAFLGVYRETAVCLPHNDCLVLQTSHYAYPLGVPVGYWGVAVFLAILLLWGVSQYGPERGRRIGLRLMLLPAAAAQLFSIYFIFLILFVIGVSCGWCLATAVLTTLLFRRAAEAVSGLRMMRYL